MNIRTRKWIPTAAVGSIAFTLTTGDALAFFPPLPTGSNAPTTITVVPTPAPLLVPPAIRPPVLIQPVDPIPVVPPPPFVPPPVPVIPQVVPPVVPPPCVHPATVPEPTTIVSGLLGLATVGGMAWKRRKNAAANDAKS